MRRITTIFDGQFLPVNVLQDPKFLLMFPSSEE